MPLLCVFQSGLQRTLAALETGLRPIRIGSVETETTDGGGLAEIRIGYRVSCFECLGIKAGRSDGFPGCFPTITRNFFFALFDHCGLHGILCGFQFIGQFVDHCLKFANSLDGVVQFRNSHLFFPFLFAACLISASRPILADPFYKGFRLLLDDFSW